MSPTGLRPPNRTSGPRTVGPRFVFGGITHLQVAGVEPASLSSAVGAQGT
jgi:hypothetical protein